jgi:antitoxin PrlF
MESSIHFWPIESNVVFNYSSPTTLSMEIAMTTLSVTAKGQITLKRDLLLHLGFKAGQKIDFEKLPDGELRVRVVRPSGSIDEFLGLLAAKNRKVVSIEEMNEVAAAGWTGLR